MSRRLGCRQRTGHSSRVCVFVSGGGGVCVRCVVGKFLR